MSTNKVMFSNIDTLNKIFTLKIIQEAYDMEYSSNLLLELLDEVYGYEKFNKYFIISGVTSCYEILGKDLIVQYDVHYEFASIYGVKDNIKDYNLNAIKEALSSDDSFINSYDVKDDLLELGLNNMAYNEDAHESYDQYVSATEDYIKNKLEFIKTKFVVSALEYTSDFLLVKFHSKKNKTDDFDQSFGTALDNFLLSL